MTRGEVYSTQKCRSTRSFPTLWWPLGTTVLAWIDFRGINEAYKGANVCTRWTACHRVPWQIGSSFYCPSRVWFCLPWCTSTADKPIIISVKWAYGMHSVVIQKMDLFCCEFFLSQNKKSKQYTSTQEQEVVCMNTITVLSTAQVRRVCVWPGKFSQNETFGRSHIPRGCRFLKQKIYS